MFKGREDDCQWYAHHLIVDSVELALLPFATVYVTLMRHSTDVRSRQRMRVLVLIAESMLCLVHTCCDSQAAQSDSSTIMEFGLYADDNLTLCCKADQASHATRRSCLQA